MDLLRFIMNSSLLGVGLAMDAFSVSIVNGFHEPEMSAGKKNKIAGVFGLLLFIGGKMLIEGIRILRGKEGKEERLGKGTLIVQGIGTEILLTKLLSS
ncbi:MAG: hypothetical protein IKN79_05790 [Eubacterium sp.]|nr:hypothetical protein [Eubacterium sp.]